MDKRNWIIAICVAIVYLAVSVALDGWAYSWVIWFIYAAYRLFFDGKSKHARGSD